MPHILHTVDQIYIRALAETSGPVRLYINTQILPQWLGPPESRFVNRMTVHWRESGFGFAVQTQEKLFTFVPAEQLLGEYETTWTFELACTPFSWASAPAPDHWYCLGEYNALTQLALIRDVLDIGARNPQGIYHNAIEHYEVDNGLLIAADKSVFVLQCHDFSAAGVCTFDSVEDMYPPERTWMYHFFPETENGADPSEESTSRIVKFERVLIHFKQ